jgi:hypothetical protein
MNAPRALCAALAALVSLIACSQTLIEFEHNSTPYVGVTVETWEAIVAKRLSANSLNRERARAIVLLASNVDAERARAETFRKDSEDAKARERIALQRLAEAVEVNVKLARKLKRRTPWATAMKVQVVAVVAIGGWAAYQRFAP